MEGKVGRLCIAYYVVHHEKNTKYAVRNTFISKSINLAIVPK